MHGAQLAAGSRDVMGNHPPPPGVLRIDAIALPELQNNERCAHFLAGVKREMRLFLTGGDAQAGRQIARKRRTPLPGPSDHGHDALAGPLDSEVGEFAVAAAPAGGRERCDLAGRQDGAARFVIVWRTDAARMVVKNELGRPREPGIEVVGEAFECGIQREDIGEDWGIHGAGILKVQGPFNDGKVEVFDGDAPDFKTGIRMAVMQFVPAPGVIQLNPGSVRDELRQRLRKGPLAVVKGEGRNGGAFGRVLPLDDGQSAQPDFLSAGQHHPGVGPDGLVTGYSVARVAHAEVELGCALEIDGNRQCRHAFVQHGRCEQVPALAQTHRKDDTSPAPLSLAVGIHARPGGQGLTRGRQLYQQIARGMGKQTATVRARTQHERPVNAAVLPDVVKLFENNDAAGRFGRSRVLKLGVHPAPHFVHFARSRVRMCQGACQSQKNTAYRETMFHGWTLLFVVRSILPR